nr:MAG TPA: hypothetical protein [Caudoviricetes sp.]
MAIYDILKSFILLYEKEPAGYCRPALYHLPLIIYYASAFVVTVPTT